MEPLRGHIVRILSDEDFVVDLGERDGLTVGDYIAVLSDKPEPLAPSLSIELRAFKATVLVTDCSDSFSIARTYKLKKPSTGTLGLSISLTAIQPKYSPVDAPEQVEKLKVAEGHKRPIERDNSPIREGDIVVKVTEEQADRGYMIVE